VVNRYGPVLQVSHCPIELPPENVSCRSLSYTILLDFWEAHMLTLGSIPHSGCCNGWPSVARQVSSLLSRLTSIVKHSLVCSSTTGPTSSVCDRSQYDPSQNYSSGEVLVPGPSPNTLVFAGVHRQAPSFSCAHEASYYLACAQHNASQT
jgi:hypothetical protein